MNTMFLLALLCYYGPTPLAALLAGYQAMQCPSWRHAFLVGMFGTIALAVTFAVAMDHLPIWTAGFQGGNLWLMHLMISPVIGLPVGLICAISVAQRNTPRSEPDLMI
jgi:hypothetical protein